MIVNVSIFQLLMKSPQKRLVDLYTIQNTPFFKVANFTSVIEKKVINPIALRKAKIAYNFGLSECSRVEKTLNTFRGDNSHQKEFISHLIG